jgi:glycosyltransferase involved in cell wall biosynthesis
MTPPHSSPDFDASFRSLVATTTRSWRSTLGRSRDEADGEKLKASAKLAGGHSLPRGMPLIVFSHLSWNWVWQRPQQFISRIAKRRPVLFVETYCSQVETAESELTNPPAHPNITVLQMHLPASRWQDGAFIDGERRRLLKKILAGQLKGRFEQPVLWFYDPMAVVPFAGQLGERAIVYDCMDELSQFKGAPPELIERERELLLCADVVFCGGRKMRQKRLPLNSNCHFYGTGVDCEHFGGALSPKLKIAEEIAALQRPVLGYFGVIDERIDYELLAKLADARTDWNIVMVGPTAKVDPAELPRRRNLHWIGPRPYAELPALTKGFSVCLMPFAINAATEYINPTKALEYMAAGRPVVSTALDEVRSNFASVARIASSHDEFIALCAKEAASPSQSRIDRGLRLAAENTWEAIVAKMEGHIAEVLAGSENSASAETPALSPVKAARLGYV